MRKHFSSWRMQVPILLIICVIAVFARHVLDGYHDQYLPVRPDKPFVANPPAPPAAVWPPALPAPKRPPPAASDLGQLLSLMAEDLSVARRDLGLWAAAQVPTIYSHGDRRGHAVTTKAMPMPPAIEVPYVPLGSGDHYDPKAEADFFVGQWLQSQAATNRAEMIALVHTAELTALDLIARLKGQSLAHRESLTKYWVNYRDFSRASTRLAELAALDALAAVPGKSVIVDGREYMTDMSRGAVNVRSVTRGNIDGDDPL